LKVLAIDFGTKRVGIAVGDSELGIALPRETIPNDGKLVDKIKSLVEKEGIGTVVLGLPLTPSGKEGQRAKLVREFASRLRKKLGSVEVVLWDERYTTVEAESRLRHIPPEKRRKVIDSVSAQVILEEYLGSL
jgi:putative Holliday junction resolvase